MTNTKKNDSDKPFLTRFWNEFLFAREFEYETPLSPDEMVAALKVLEKQPHDAWFLTFGKLEDKLEFTRYGDKVIDFKIHVKDEEKSWWQTGLRFHQTEGKMIANPETGMTTIKGKTQFSSEYYLSMFALFIVNLMSYAFDNDTMITSLVWAGLMVITWFALYHERNALAERIDDIIMHAKSEGSLAILEGETPEDSSEAETLFESRQFMENELIQQEYQK